MEKLIKEILSHNVHEAEIKFPEELEKLGRELYGLKPCGCGNKLIEIYIRLYKNGLKMAELKKQNKRIARLKEGVVLRVPTMGITWTNAVSCTDFTDEKAIKVLKKYSALRLQFEVLPLIKEIDEKKSKEKADPKITEEKKKIAEEEKEIEAEILAEEKAEKAKK